MALPKISNPGIAIYAITLASAMTFSAFFLSRGDHDLKLMSLTAVLSLASGLVGIAGTLLVGISAYQKLTGVDLPPGSALRSTATSSETVLTPSSTEPLPKA